MIVRAGIVSIIRDIYLWRWSVILGIIGALGTVRARHDQGRDRGDHGSVLESLKAIKSAQKNLDMITHIENKKVAAKI